MAPDPGGGACTAVRCDDGDDGDDDESFDAANLRAVNSETRTGAENMRRLLV
jgi:hypothetical protein